MDRNFARRWITMALEKHISSLLYTHDCVIVPELGGFLAQYRSARLERDRSRILPPSKQVSFNRELKRNDGLLVDRVAAANGIPHDAAQKLVQAEVTKWSNELSGTGRLELDRIGILFTGADHRIQFEPDLQVNYLKDATGLRTIPASPVVRKRKEPVTAELEKHAPKHDTPLVIKDLIARPANGEGRRMERMWAAAAAAALLLTLGTWWMWNSGIPNDAPQLGKFWPFEPAPDAQYVPRKAAAIQGSPFTRDEPLQLDEAERGIKWVPLTLEGEEMPVDLGEEEPTIAEVDNTEVVMDHPQGRYHVIVGCFREEPNATGLVERLQAKGAPARVLDQHKGLFRIAYGSYPNKEMALSALATVRREGDPGAWLLIK